MTNIKGSASDNVLSGQSGNDLLSGLEGNDRVFGRAGNDYLNGGSGDDSLFNYKGNDTLVGGAGDDLINDAGFAYNDTTGPQSFRREEIDTLTAGVGKDIFQLWGGSGLKGFILTMIMLVITITL